MTGKGRRGGIVGKEDVVAGDRPGTAPKIL